MKNKGSIFTLSAIMLINALAYGTIIPLLYPYASRFGITPLGLSILFASFSAAQLVATPIIGRLSDRYGRKPLLVFSILGTSISLGMFALARNVWMLYVSRLIDGVTGGNISVAQAVIADTVPLKERTKYFGILGAAFGFGFLAGPALGGLLSQYGITTPFWFAAGLALLATFAAVFFLKETVQLSVERKRAKHEPLFRLSHYTHALFSPTIGLVLFISLLTSIGYNGWIIGFQAFTNDVLHFTPKDIGIIFALSGLFSILMQGGVLPILLKLFPDKRKVLTTSIILSMVSLLGFFFVNSFVSFVIIVLIFTVVTAPQAPMITALLSERTRKEDQGGALGINQSYSSLGQIIGPLIAGAITLFAVRDIFLVNSLMFFFALLATIPLYKAALKKENL